jgi:hypothetical protein
MNPLTEQNNMEPAPAYCEIYNFDSLILCSIDKVIQPPNQMLSQQASGRIVIDFDEPGQPITLNYCLRYVHSYENFGQHKMLVHIDDGWMRYFQTSRSCGAQLEHLNDMQLTAIPICITRLLTTNQNSWTFNEVDLEVLRARRKKDISVQRVRFLLTLREVCASFSWYEMPPDMLREITLAAYPRLLWKQ